MRVIGVLSLIGFLTACGMQDEYVNKRTPYKPIPQPKTSELVIIATATFSVNFSDVDRLFATYSPATVVLAPGATFALNTSGWASPAITNDVLSFGSLAISTLSANNLRVCGTRGKTKCGNAYIRVYTTGAGEGFWNTDIDGEPSTPYGVPMTVTNALTVVPLDAGSAVAVQTFVIGAKVNTLKLSNFSPASYPFGGNFTEAGAGNYSATINIELALGL